MAAVSDGSPKRLTIPPLRRPAIRPRKRPVIRPLRRPHLVGPSGPRRGRVSGDSNAGDLAPAEALPVTT